MAFLRLLSTLSYFPSLHFSSLPQFIVFFPPTPFKFIYVLDRTGAYRGWVEKLRKRDHLEQLGADGRIIVK
jgi:hypothetical protein